MKALFVSCGMLVCAWGLILAPVDAIGQGVVLPMIFGNTVAIVDEQGRNLQGSSGTGEGDLVQIYRISSGSILPPNINGTPQPNNVAIPGGTAFIGHMVGSHLVDSGLFAISIASNQPPVGTRFFVRVFNEKTLGASSFYGDSPEYTIQASKDTYVVSIAAADRPLDTDDDDLDMLHNSWEKTLGSSSETSDTDRDGMSDYNEWLAGTDPTDDTNFLRIEDLWATGGVDMDVMWQSVSGKCYYVEYANDLMPGDPAFAPLHATPVEASGDTTTMTVQDGALIEFGLYRVRLATCP